MAGTNNNLEGSGDATGSGGKPTDTHTRKLQDDAYTPKLHHQIMKRDGTLEPQPATTGPKLTDLTIDTTPGAIHQHDEPRRGDSYPQRQAALKREMPINNPNFQKMVENATEFVSHDGNFDINMRHALNEANQSDHTLHTGHQHVDDMLKYINAHLTDTTTTLRRHGNIVEVWETTPNSKNDPKKPEWSWDLDKNAPVPDKPRKK